MKRYLLIILILFIAPTIIDQTDAEFNTGTPTNINISNNQLQLSGSSGSYSSSGYYISRVLDLGSNPEIEIAWSANNPSQTTLLISSRTGPTPTPDSSWSGFSTSYSDSSGSEVTNPTNRYFQYRIDMSSLDGQNTPEINSVSTTYEQQGPIVTTNTNTQNLHQDTTGSYRYYVDIQDTLTLTQVDARHRIGSDAYNSYTSMTQDSANTYYIDIAEPTGGWYNRRGENLSIQVRAENNNLATTTTLIEEIDYINAPPVLDPISDQQAQENTPLEFSVSASDADGDNLTYTTTHGSITKFTNTIADFFWTPTGSHIGLTNVTITVSDGQAQDSQTFTVNTTGVNHPPVIREINDVTVYHGQRVLLDVIVDDPNHDENLTFSTSPRIPITPVSESNASTVYVARINFTPFDDFRGENTIYVSVSDREGETDTTSFNLTVNYCGDGVCHANENATSCPADCTQEDTQERSYIAVEFPDRICTNQTLEITAYNASSRYVCFLDGRTTQSAAAWCSQLQGVDMQFYELQGQVRADRGVQTTNEQGQVEFVADNPGTYRLIANAEGYVGAQETFIAKECAYDISNTGETIIRERPDLQASPMPPGREPRPERPQLTEDEVSMLAILIWYMIIPLLMASMIYVSNEYYALYKDTDPKLLQMRIFFAKQKSKWAPKIRPYTNKAKQVLAPAWNVLKQYVIIPVNETIIKPIRKKIGR